MVGDDISGVLGDLMVKWLAGKLRLKLFCDGVCFWVAWFPFQKTWV